MTISSELLRIFEELKCDGDEDKGLDDKYKISVGDLIDTRNTNKDFRRFVARVRKIDEGTNTVLVEYGDGQIKPYSIKNGITIFSKQSLKDYVKILKENMDRGSMSGPIVEKVFNTLNRWLTGYKKK